MGIDQHAKAQFVGHRQPVLHQGRQGRSGKIGRGAAAIDHGAGGHETLPRLARPSHRHAVICEGAGPALAQHRAAGRQFAHQPKVMRLRQTVTVAVIDRAQMAVEAAFFLRRQVTPQRAGLFAEGVHHRLPVLAAILGGAAGVTQERHDITQPAWNLTLQLHRIGRKARMAARQETMRRQKGDPSAIPFIAQLEQPVDDTHTRSKQDDMRTWRQPPRADSRGTRRFRLRWRRLARRSIAGRQHDDIADLGRPFARRHGKTAIATPGDAQHQFAAHPDADIVAQRQRIGKALISIVGKHAFRHENLAEAGNGGRNGIAEAGIAAQPGVEIVGIVVGNREVAHPAVENRTDLSAGKRLAAIDLGMRIEHQQFERRAHPPQQCDRAHQSRKAAPDNRDPWHGNAIAAERGLREEAAMDRHAISFRALLTKPVHRKNNTETRVQIAARQNVSIT